VSINPVEDAVEILFTSDGESFEDVDLDYYSPRDPSDSNLSWEFENSRDKLILKRYPPKLLDRAAMALEAGERFHLREEFEDTYSYERVSDWTEVEKHTDVELEVKAEDGVLGLRIKNDFGASGIKASIDNGVIRFKEYLSDSFEDFDLTGSPERKGKAYLGQFGFNDNYEDFLEGLELEKHYLVVR
jgi:hypothetical protein